MNYYLLSVIVEGREEYVYQNSDCGFYSNENVNFLDKDLLIYGADSPEEIKEMLRNTLLINVIDRCLRKDFEDCGLEPPKSFQFDLRKIVIEGGEKE